MAGGPMTTHAASTADRGVPDQLARWLRGLSASEFGEDAPSSSTAPSVNEWAVLRRDVERVRSLVLLDHSPTEAPLVAWRSGASPHAAPEGGAGLIVGGLDPGRQTQSRWDAVTAMVVMPPGTRGQRLLILSPPSEGNTGMLAIPPSARKKSKQDVLLAVLALAGPDGASEEELFRHVYGFKFNAALHAATFNVLLHRCRAQLGDVAEFVRSEGRLMLRSTQTLMVGDPRCAPVLEQRALQLLSTGQASSSKEVAERLGVPLRTAQSVMESLSADGAAQRVRRGNRVTYEIDDTTFRPPTQV